MSVKGLKKSSVGFHLKTKGLGLSSSSRWSVIRTPSLPDDVVRILSGSEILIVRFGTSVDDLVC